jgi:hypothetical protein
MIIKQKKATKLMVAFFVFTEKTFTFVMDSQRTE